MRYVQLFRVARYGRCINMKFFQSDKRLLAKLGIGAVLVLAGVVIGVAGLLVVAVRHQPDQKELEAVRLQDTVKYIQTEQAHLGIDCHALRKTLQDFLENDIHPALKARQPGRDWNKYISPDVRERMGEVRDYYFACGRLYRAAQNAQWDGLKDIEFAVGLDREIITLNTLIRFGEFGEECDATCLDGNYRELQDAVKKIERVLN